MNLKDVPVGAKAVAESSYERLVHHASLQSIAVPPIIRFDVAQLEEKDDDDKPRWVVNEVEVSSGPSWMGQPRIINYADSEDVIKHQELAVAEAYKAWTIRAFEPNSDKESDRTSEKRKHNEK